MNSFERLIDGAREHGYRTRPVNDHEAMVQCPVHEPDNDPSVHVTYDATSGRTLMCDMHDETDNAAILRAFGLTFADLFDEAPKKPGDDRPTIPETGRDPLAGFGLPAAPTGTVSHFPMTAPGRFVMPKPHPIVDFHPSNRFASLCGQLGIPVSNGLLHADCPCCHGKGTLSVLYASDYTGTLLHCSNGCAPADLVHALGYYRQAAQIRSRDKQSEVAEVFDDDRGAEFKYDDGLVVHRDAAKRIRQSGATKSNKGRHPLWRAQETAEAARNGETILLVEGEKDAATALAMGYAATTAPGGGGNFRANVSTESLKTTLTGAKVVAVVDKDRTGAAWKRQIERLLAECGCAPATFVEAAGKAHDTTDAIMTGSGFEPYTGEGDAIDDGEGDKPYRLVNMNDVTATRIQWYWPNHVPKGKVMGLIGDPGVGKSTLTLDIAARVTTGAQWPDGAPGCTPGQVLVLSAEDAADDTIKPRLMAAGADTSKIDMLTDIYDDKHKDLPMVMDEIIPRLRLLLEEKPYALIIVDVLMAYLGATVDSNKDQDIRAKVMKPFTRLCEDYGCTIILLRHMNKNQVATIYRGGGSIGIVGAERIEFAAIRDPENPERNILACNKSNIGPMPKAIAYTLTDAPEYGCARIEWGEEIDQTTPAHASGTASDGEPSSKSDRAAEFILKYFHDNARQIPEIDNHLAVRAKDVVDAAEGMYSETLLSNTRRRKLADKLSTTKTKRGWWWYSPDDPEQKDTTDQQDIPDGHADEGPKNDLAAENSMDCLFHLLGLTFPGEEGAGR